MIFQHRQFDLLKPSAGLLFFFYFDRKYGKESLWLYQIINWALMTLSVSYLTSMAN